MRRWWRAWWAWLASLAARRAVYRRWAQWELEALSYHVIDVPVVNGVATLPDGRTVVSSANVVRVPVLNDRSTPG